MSAHTCRQCGRTQSIYWLDLRGLATALQLEAEYQIAMWPTCGKLETRYEWYYRVYMSNVDTLLTGCKEAQS